MGVRGIVFIKKMRKQDSANIPFEKTFMSTFFVVCMAALVGIVLSSCVLYAQDRGFTETQRKKWNAECDKAGLLSSHKMVTDMSDRFIAPPPDSVRRWMGDVDIAKTPPSIDFILVTGMKPEYFPEDNVGYWADFGDLTLAPNGKYYFGVGDHRGRDGNSYAYEFDPEKRDCRQIIDFGALCGWKARGVGDGKMHGEIGAMSDGSLWMLTYWDPMPGWTKEDYDRWPGSNLVQYDTKTGKAENLGIPLAKAGWPYFTLDSTRGILFAVGSKNEILAYDVKNRRVKFAGIPPDGVKWWTRCTMLDPETGIFWGCTQDEPYHFVSYDPRTGTFVKHPEFLPNDLGRNKNSASRLRGYTERRTGEGFIWVDSENGTLFKFWPDTRKTETVAMLWADYTYVPRISLSGDDRFIYYVGNTKRTAYPTKPVVQFDTRTGRKKVLAFLDQYYFDRYGYDMGSVHGSTLSGDDATFTIVFNGAFLPPDKGWQDTPSIIAVHIPESERR